MNPEINKKNEIRNIERVIAGTLVGMLASLLLSNQLLYSLCMLILLIAIITMTIVDKENKRIRKSVLSFTLLLVSSSVLLSIYPAVSSLFTVKVYSLIVTILGSIFLNLGYYFLLPNKPIVQNNIKMIFKGLIVANVLLLIIAATLSRNIPLLPTLVSISINSILIYSYIK